MRIFATNQGMRKIPPQADTYYSADKILSITRILDEETILQEASLPVKQDFRGRSSPIPADQNRSRCLYSNR
jgi:hypothetical protein